jgi:hypothetical protein
MKIIKKVSFGNDVKVKLVKKIYKNNKEDEWSWICLTCDTKKYNKRICSKCGSKKKATNISRSIYSHKLGGKKLKLKEKVVDIDVVNDDDNLHFKSYLIGTLGTALNEGLWLPCKIVEVENNDSYVVEFDDTGSKINVLKDQFKPVDIEKDISYEETRHYFNNLAWM